MNLLQEVKMALKNLATNKLRAFLTMLGIIIGVSAVILLVALSQGATKQVTEQVQGLGSNLLTVSITGRGTQTTLDYKKVMSFAEIPEIGAIAPIVSGNVNASNGSKHVRVNIEGTNPEYETVRQHKVQAGRFLLPLDLEYRQKVALLGSSTAKELFGLADPIGQYIKLEGTPFKVIGLLEEKGSTMGGSNDDKIIIPFNTAERLLASTGVRSFYVQAASEKEVNVAIAKLEQKLTKEFRNDEDSYRIFNQQDILDTMGAVTTTMTMLLAGIASISLLVGGIGIMNIMLVSVTERTREIGIRKAIGAKKRNILFQFLIESVVLCLIGGLIGVGLGVGGASLIASLVGMEIAVSFNLVMIAVGFSVFVGVLFGMLPANKAANLNPIEALRFE